MASKSGYMVISLIWNGNLIQLTGPDCTVFSDDGSQELYSGEIAGLADTFPEILRHLLEYGYIRPTR